jgi:transcriptional regulator with XRE-family HTH domain
MQPQFAGLGYRRQMAAKERPADVGSQRARRILAEIGGELRNARMTHGLSQAAVGRAVKMSRSQVGRVERAEVPLVSLANLARLMAVVGLELSVRAYASGPPIRDAAHRALLDRFRERVGPGVAWRFEVPLERPGDQRAWDAVMTVADSSVAVEAETRPRDVQELQRRLVAKRRDDPRPAAVVLLLSDTRHNRALVRNHGEVLRADLPMPAAAILGALAAGRCPAGSGFVLV